MGKLRYFITIFAQITKISIIRKTKRFAFFERTAHFFKTKRTSVGYPLFQKFFDWLTPVLCN